jgi:uncharacterized damage-inducible protein DinB
MDYQKELIEEFDREIALTRKVLDAIPEDVDFTWKPNPKSFSLGRLAAHVAETPCEWAISTLTLDRLDFDMQSYKPYIAENKSVLLEKFDKESAEASAALRGFDPAKWDDTWSMGTGDQTWVSDSRYRVWRTWVISHMVHHRAQPPPSCQTARHIRPLCRRHVSRSEAARATLRAQSSRLSF